MKNVGICSISIDIVDFIHNKQAEKPTEEEEETEKTEG